MARQGSRVPQERRRVRRRLHRQLYRAEDDRSRALRNDPASGRIRNVLFAVMFVRGVRAANLTAQKTQKALPVGAPFVLRAGAVSWQDFCATPRSTGRDWSAEA